MKKIFSVLIDTKHKGQNPSKFKVKLPDYFIRNPLNKKAKYDWYISIKNFAMLNSFSNVTRGINNTIILYEERVADSVLNIPDTIDDIDLTLFNEIPIYLDEGNPNVIDLQTHFNDLFQAYNIEIEYLPYSSKYSFTYTIPFAQIGLPVRKQFLYFKDSYDLFGMESDRLYPFYNPTHNPTIATYGANVMGDYLLKFHIDPSSDFQLRDINYCNMGNNFTECELFWMLNIAVLPYDVIYYQRTTEDLIPINLFKDSINEFQINLTNQDNQEVEGLADYQMTIEFICVEKQEHLNKILDLLKHIYLWVGTYFSRKMM